MSISRPPTPKPGAQANPPRVGLLAIEVFARVGGIQEFNKRLLHALGQLAGALGPVDALSLRDACSEQLCETVRISGSGGSRFHFIRTTLRSAPAWDLLLVCHINLLPIAFAAKLLAPQLKIVLFVHGIEVWNERDGRKRRFFEPLLLRSVDRVASVSRYTAGVMAKEFNVPSSRFRIFPNAVDIKGFAKKTKPAPNQIALAVTRLGAEEGRKNVDTLVRAFSKVLKRFPGARLQVVGEGELKATYAALADDLAIGASVDFLGRLSDEALAEAYRRATVFVLPSSKEGFGIVYLEAWCHSLPVICSSAGAGPEVVTDELDGWVVPPRSEEALASVIEQALSNPKESLALGWAGYEKVSMYYSLEQFQSRLLALLMEIWRGGRLSELGSN